MFKCVLNTKLFKNVINLKYIRHRYLMIILNFQFHNVIFVNQSKNNCRLHLKQIELFEDDIHMSSLSSY